MSLFLSFIIVSQQQHDHTWSSLLCLYSSVYDMLVPLTMMCPQVADMEGRCQYIE